MNAFAAWMQRLRARVLIALAAASLLALLLLTDLGRPADEALYGALARAMAPAADPRIVVVEIDEPSLAAIGRWPWSRRVHAQLVERLTASGARAVALNLLLSDPALYDPEGDALLARALRRNGRVVLPVYVEPADANGPEVELVPIPEFATAAAALGHVGSGSDADSVLRQVYLHAGLGWPQWPALALALQQQGQASAPALEPPGGWPLQSRTRWVRTEPVRIAYARDPRGYPRHAYADVLEGRVSAEELRGRWIVVGASAAGMGRAARFPGGGDQSLSAQFHLANTLDTLLHGRAVKPVAPLAQFLLSLLLVLAPLALLGLPGLGRAEPLLLSAMTLSVVMSWLLLRLGQLWFAPVACMAVLALGLLLALAQRLRNGHAGARTDAPTGLPNQRRFNRLLTQAVREVRRNGRPLSLMLVEMDGGSRRFPDVAPEHSRLLIHSLRARARRPHDVVARLSPRRFALLLPDTPLHAAAAIATTVHVDLAEAPPSRLSVSIGIATCSDDGRSGDPATLLDQAEEALLQAQRAGGNCSISRSAPAASGQHAASPGPGP